MGKKESKPKVVEPVALEVLIDEEPPTLPPEAVVLLEAARAEMERALRASFTRAETALAEQYVAMNRKLADTRSEIQRLHAETQEMRKSPVNAFVKDAQQRLLGL